MSTQPFGQQPAFGAAQAPAPPAPEIEEPKKSGRTVVIAVAAGVVALGVLGGAAALVLTGPDGETVDTALPPASQAPTEPTSSATSARATPLPTAAVQGRNVFLPLVEESVEAGADGGGADPVASAPTAAPTTAPTAAPAPPVVQTVSVPGPTVVETVEVPGPTTTVSVPSSTETVSTFVHDVTVVSVQDETVVDSPATFVVNDETIEVEKGDVFKTVFVYQGYDPVERVVSFNYGSDLWVVSVGTEIGLGRP